MEHEKTLPKEERQFVDLDTTFEFSKFVGWPFAIYLVWLVAYYLITFKLGAKRI